LLKKHGFENAEARRIPDDTPAHILVQDLPQKKLSFLPKI
jgi:hypothetical protein